MLIAAWSILAAEDARGDTNTNETLFINSVRDAGIAANQTDNHILRNGFLACAASSQPEVGDDLITDGIKIAERILGNKDNNPEADQQFIDLAQKYLCPREASQQ